MRNLHVKAGEINTLVPIGFISKQAVAFKQKVTNTLVIMYSNAGGGVKNCNQNVL